MCGLTRVTRTGPMNVLSTPDTKDSRTQWTLIRKLSGSDCDEATWMEFDRIYRKQIYAVARKMGLRHEEAEDAVQETMVALCDHIQNFKPNPSLGSFRSWLLQGARWRILSQFRKRQKKQVEEPQGQSTETSEGTSLINRVPDPDSLKIDEMLMEEWKREMLEAATQRVKTQVSPELFQIFDLSYLRGLPLKKVAVTLGISSAKVYLARHRVANLIKKEVQRFERKLAL